MKHKDQNIQSILFVCLGNICRSPLAQGVAQSLLATYKLDIKIDSAGTGHWHIGEAPCENSMQVAHLHKIDISHQRARQVKISDFDSFDLVVALDAQNEKDLKKMGATNVCKLGDFGYNSKDVPDPYFFEGFEGFEKVYTMIQECVTTLLDDLQKGSL